MAAITTITKGGPSATTPAVPTTAQFKSHVYSKYRELLGSYNDKANEILQTYPAYRVQEDHGFALNGDNYGGPPQSTVGNSARRIQAQLPAEPPACVQNAMMRRDKQPFTYTPGGIDLSQIKSPRMAKRISRNANSEGVTGQPKVSPLAQNNGSNHSTNGSSNGSHNPVSPAATLGAAAMGMPFQVFPTGPPAPPPPPPPTGRVVPGVNGAGSNRPMPPPPPPPAPAPAEIRKSPRPQVFEPPPMGMRPEIKIPSNPMSSLRKAPRPQPKNDFWIEEYRREKQQDAGPQIPRPVPPPSYSYTNRDLDDEVAKNTFNRTDELTVRGDPLAQKRSPSPSNLTKPRENGSASSSIKTPPVYGQSPVPPNLPPPITPTKVSTTNTSSPNTKVSPPPVRPKPSLSPVSISSTSQPSTNSYTGREQPTAVVKNTNTITPTTTAQTGSGPAQPSLPPPPPPPPAQPSTTATPQKREPQSTSQSVVSPSTLPSSSTGPSSSSPSSTSTSAGAAASATTTVPSVGAQRPAAQALGSLYIPPVHEVFANSKQSLLTQASPPWMSSRHNSLKEQPEWVNRDEQEQPGASSNSTEHGSGSQQQQQRTRTTPPPPEKEQQTVTNNNQHQPQAHRANQHQAAAGGKSESETTKSVDSIVTAPSPVSARPSPASSQQLTQNSGRPSADVSGLAQQSTTPSAQQQQQQYVQQLQQAARTTQPSVGLVQPTVTMPVSRPYPQQGSVYAQAQPVYSPQPVAGSQKERIIPIQIEKSPVQSPATAPSFAPPPYYSPAPQYGPTSVNSGSSIQSPIPVGFATPHSGFTTPTAMFTNPNHFVNQGYNNISYPPTPTAQQPHPMYQHHQHYAPPQTPPLHHHPLHPQPPHNQQHQQQHQQQRMQNHNSTANVRIVPIKVEGAEHTARGPLSNTPAIIQSGDRSYIIHDIPLEAKIRFLKNRLSDPRSSNNTQAWNGNNAPNQSRSFRVLQQITDTLDESEAGKGAKETTGEAAGHDQADGQQFGRSAQESADGQLRRLQLSNEDKALMNRVKTQVDGEVYLHNEEDPRYRGAAIPSKAFKYLQNMTDSGQAANQSNTGSGNRTQQMFNRGNNTESDGESPAQYVPPSEQKVEEPKKYTGGSIPSRSFRMLQAMTGSDAPADPNSSDSEGSSVKLSHCSGTDIRYSPYPYPHPQPYYCCNPNWHYYDPSTNPQYYPPPPPPPSHAPGYYYPPPPPPPPPGHYDRAGGYYGGYMSPHHFYYAPEPCSPCTPPPYYQLSQPQTAYCESLPGEAIHTYVITTPPPRIVVTPTPADTGDSCSDSEQQHQQRRREQLGELHDVVGEFATESHQQRPHPHPLTRSQSSLKRLSERLSNFNHGGGGSPSPCETETKSSPSSVRCSPCSPLNERYRTYEESTSSVPSSQSEASDSEDEGSAPARRKKSSAGGELNGTYRNNLREGSVIGKGAITPPVSKKQTNEGERRNEDEEHEVDPNEEEGDEEEDEDEEDEEEEEGVSEDEETVGYGATDGAPAEEHLPHQLSVIFEEESVYQSTVASRRASVCSNSSTLSDCSSTLANDLDEDEDTEGKPSGNRTDDDIDRLEEADMERSLVSVRLPLKLSFSKSPNNEDIATLVVGESEITGSSEQITGAKGVASHTFEEDSGDESDTEEDESEADTATDEEDSTTETPTATVEKEEHEADTDVTVTITIPSLSSKAGSNGKERRVDRSENAKHDEPLKTTPFKIDYEETSEVSVSVSLPLKPKSGSSASEIAKSESTTDEKPPEAQMEKEIQGNADVKPDEGGEEEEEVDFWSQIGDEEDDYQRPVRSFSRDMWGSREFSVDRQSVWSQDDEEASTTGTTDFWSAENGPTEASDMWKLDKLQPVSNGYTNGEEEAQRGSVEYWQKENERLVKDLYKGRNGQCSTLDAKDENNNKSRMTQDVPITKGSQKKTEEHSEEEELEEHSDSEDNSEEYETSNTSKEESEVEQDRGDSTAKEAMGNRKEVAPPISESKSNELAPGTVVCEKLDKDKKLSVKERISLFETQRNVPSPCGGETLQAGAVRSASQNNSNRLRPLSRQKLSCDESEAEDDSGVTSDMSKHISEVETDSECFPEMRKMTRYQRAATHSRLFKLLQDESNNGDSEDEDASEDISKEVCKEKHEKQEKQQQQQPRGRKSESVELSPSPLTPEVRANAAGKMTTADESVEGRRDRLTLPISQQSSSGNESLSSSGSSASPVSGTLQNEKLAEELVQSLLMKKKGRLFRNLPLEKLHAAALKILQEDLESNGTLSSTEDNLATVDSTPALTPQEFKSEFPSSYADYYDTWCNDSSQQLPNGCYSDTGSDCGMVKVFRTVPEHQLSPLGRKDAPRAMTGTPNGHWSPRCPRVFSNKNVPRLAEVRECEATGTESPRSSRPPSRASNNRSPFPQTMDDYSNQRNTANRQFKLQ